MYSSPTPCQLGPDIQQNDTLLFLISFSIASSTSASEAATERLGKKHRSQVFILVTNLVLACGTLVSLSFFLIVSRLPDTTTEECRRIQRSWYYLAYRVRLWCPFPLVFFYFRMLVLNSSLYRKTAMRKRYLTKLALKRYWPRLLGTAGVWFIYDFVVFPLGVFLGTIISTVVKNPTLQRVAECSYSSRQLVFQVSSSVSCCCLVSARGSTFMLGLSGFLVLGLTIGLAYDKIVKITPLFVILYGLIAALVT